MGNIFIRRPILAMVISIIIVILGLLSVKQLPIEQYPDITPPVVEVTASYQGADAVTVDESVATPLGQSIMGVSDMMYMQSTSANDGSMSLQITFDIGSDPDMNTIFTQNRTSTAVPMLPAVVREQGVTTNKTMSSFLMVVALYSDGRYDGNFLSNYAMINIQNELLKINGVGKVSVMGAGEYSMRIWIEPDKLDYLGVSINDITSAIESQSGVFPVGKLGGAPAPPQTQFTYTVVLPPAISTPEEYENIVIRTLENGAQVLLKDVANVTFGSQTYNVSSSFNGKPCTMLSIYQAPGSNALDVGNQVKATMKELSANFADGIYYENIVDTTTVITKGVKEILYTLLFALILVILIIYLFIQDIRAMIIPVVAIPVSLIGAFMLFPLFGFTINIFSLLGLVLAIGLVVDDAIVVVEAVQVHIEQGKSPKEATILAMKSVSSPIIATTLVLSAVFVPVSLMGGITGRLYQQFAITIAFSVIISSFNALTLTPALCSIWLRPRKPRTTGFFGAFNRWFSKNVERYLSFANVITRHAVRSLFFIAVVSAAAVVLFKVIPNGFLPEEDQGFLMTSVTLPEAASLERTEQAMNDIYEILSERDDIENVSAAAGFNMLSGVAAPNSGIIFLSLVDWDKRSLSASQIADELNKDLYFMLNSCTAYTFGPPAIPGIGTSSGFSLVLQDKGGNTPEYLMKQADIFLESANKRPEIASAYTEFSTGIPQRKVVIDSDAAFKQGINMSEIHDLLTTFLGGAYINNFNRFGRLYQTYIQAESQYRQKPSDLNNYFVQNSEGTSVPLSSFVTIVDTTGVEYLSQFNLYRSINIMGNPANGYTSTDAMDALEEVAEKTLPDDMGYTWSGMSYQEKNAASHSGMTYLSAIVFVFLVLAALYESWSLPFSILLGIPFAVFGALLFIFIAHLFASAYINDIFFQVSLVMLIGLAAKNAILIVEYAVDEFNQGKSLIDAAMSAAKLRVRPIIMTAFAFILGVSPLIFATGSNAAARNVMGMALLGGMLIATMLGLFIYPMLYVFIGKIGKFEKKRARVQAVEVKMNNHEQEK